MRTKTLLWLVAGLGLAAFTGCVSTVDGRQRAAMPFSTNDKVERQYKRKPLEIWDAAKDVMRYFGTLTGEDVARSVLQGNVDTRTVWIKVEAVDSEVSLVTVQCRTKGGNADRDLAAFLTEQIAVRLATGNLSPAMPPRRTN